MLRNHVRKWLVLLVVLLITLTPVLVWANENTLNFEVDISPKFYSLKTLLENSYDIKFNPNSTPIFAKTVDGSYAFDYGRTGWDAVQNFYKGVFSSLATTFLTLTHMVLSMSTIAFYAAIKINVLQYLLNPLEKFTTNFPSNAAFTTLLSLMLVFVTIKLIHALLKAQFTNIVKIIGLTILIMGFSIYYFSNSSVILGKMIEVADGLSATTINLLNVNGSNYIAKGDALTGGVTGFLDTTWNITLHKPWYNANFMGIDVEKNKTTFTQEEVDTINERINDLKVRVDSNPIIKVDPNFQVSTSTPIYNFFITLPSQSPVRKIIVETLANEDIDHGDHKALLYSMNGDDFSGDLATSIISFILSLVVAIFLLYMSFMIFMANLAATYYALLIPFNLLIGIFPDSGWALLGKNIKDLVGALIARIVYILYITIVFLIYSIISAVPALQQGLILSQLVLVAILGFALLKINEYTTQAFNAVGLGAHGNVMRPITQPTQALYNKVKDLAGIYAGYKNYKNLETIGDSFENKEENITTTTPSSTEQTINNYILLNPNAFGFNDSDQDIPFVFDNNNQIPAQSSPPLIEMQESLKTIEETRNNTVDMVESLEPTAKPTTRSLTSVDMVESLEPTAKPTTRSLTSVDMVESLEPTAKPFTNQNFIQENPSIKLEVTTATKKTITKEDTNKIIESMGTPSAEEPIETKEPPPLT